jgi:ABC-type lipoprotein export system ATPase subunit
VRVVVHRKSEVYRGYKAERARGLFNVSEEDGSEFHLEADIPIELPDWQVGIVVGSSGSGKSSIGAELKALGFHEWTGGRWSKDKPIVEAIDGDFDKVTGVLSSVGLGAVPAWLRPHSVLSNGERFRADCAKLLLSDYQDVVVDEFTSVLDRQVAQVGAAAFVKAWRRRGGKLVLLTCHHDILDWVLPDWVFDTDRKHLFMGEFAFDQVAKHDLIKYPEVGRLVIKK